MERLWREPPDDVPWPTLAGNAERWARELPERYDGPLLDEALAAIRELAPTRSGSSSATRTCTAATFCAPSASRGS